MQVFDKIADKQLEARQIIATMRLNDITTALADAEQDIESDEHLGKINRNIVLDSAWPNLVYASWNDVAQDIKDVIFKKFDLWAADFQAKRDALKAKLDVLTASRANDLPYIQQMKELVANANAAIALFEQDYSSEELYVAAVTACNQVRELENQVDRIQLPVGKEQFIALGQPLWQRDDYKNVADFEGISAAHRVAQQATITARLDAVTLKIFQVTLQQANYAITDFKRNLTPAFFAAAVTTCNKARQFKAEEKDVELPSDFDANWQDYRDVRDYDSVVAKFRPVAAQVAEPVAAPAPVAVAVTPKPATKEELKAFEVAIETANAAISASCNDYDLNKDLYENAVKACKAARTIEQSMGELPENMYGTQDLWQDNYKDAKQFNFIVGRKAVFSAHRTAMRVLNNPESSDMQVETACADALAALDPEGEYKDIISKLPDICKKMRDEIEGRKEKFGRVNNLIDQAKTAITADQVVSDTFELEPYKQAINTMDKLVEAIKPLISTSADDYTPKQVRDLTDQYAALCNTLINVLCSISVKVSGAFEQLSADASFNVAEAVELAMLHMKNLQQYIECLADGDEYKAKLTSAMPFVENKLGDMKNNFDTWRGQKCKYLYASWKDTRRSIDKLSLDSRTIASASDTTDFLKQQLQNNKPLFSSEEYASLEKEIATTQEELKNMTFILHTLMPYLGMVMKAHDFAADAFFIEHGIFFKVICEPKSDIDEIFAQLQGFETATLSRQDRQITFEFLDLVAQQQFFDYLAAELQRLAAKEEPLHKQFAELTQVVLAAIDAANDHFSDHDGFWPGYHSGRDIKTIDQALKSVDEFLQQQKDAIGVAKFRELDGKVTELKNKAMEVFNKIADRQLEDKRLGVTMKTSYMKCHFERHKTSGTSFSDDELKNQFFSEQDLDELQAYWQNVAPDVKAVIFNRFDLGMAEPLKDYYALKKEVDVFTASRANDLPYIQNMKECVAKANDAIALFRYDGLSRDLYAAAVAACNQVRELQGQATMIQLPEVKEQFMALASDASPWDWSDYCDVNGYALFIAYLYSGATQAISVSYEKAMRVLKQALINITSYEQDAQEVVAVCNDALTKLNPEGDCKHIISRLPDIYQPMRDELTKCYQDYQLAIASIQPDAVTLFLDDLNPKVNAAKAALAAAQAKPLDAALYQKLEEAKAAITSGDVKIFVKQHTADPKLSSIKAELKDFIKQCKVFDVSRAELQRAAQMAHDDAAVVADLIKSNLGDDAEVSQPEESVFDRAFSFVSGIFSPTRPIAPVTPVAPAQTKSVEPKPVVQAPVASSSSDASSSAVGGLFKQSAKWWTAKEYAERVAGRKQKPMCPVNIEADETDLVDRVITSPKV